MPFSKINNKANKQFYNYLKFLFDKINHIVTDFITLQILLETLKEKKMTTVCFSNNYYRLFFQMYVQNITITHGKRNASFLLQTFFITRITNGIQRNNFEVLF